MPKVPVFDNRLTDRLKADTPMTSKPLVTATKNEAPYGLRADGTPKGPGWLGEIKATDGSVMTELSATFNFGGVETAMPLLVPTLTQEEIETLASGNPTDEIFRKAYQHGADLMRKGKSPFKDNDLPVDNSVQGVVSNYNELLYNLGDPSPDEYARKLQMGRATGYTVDLIQAADPEITENYTRESLIKHVEDNPAIMKYLANRDNMGVSRDDTKFLLSVGNLFPKATKGDVAKDTLRALGALPVNALVTAGEFTVGGVSFGLGVLDRASRWVSNTTGLSYGGMFGNLAEQGRATLQNSRDFYGNIDWLQPSDRIKNASVAENPSVLLDPEFLIHGVAQVAGSMVPVIATGGAAGAAGFSAAGAGAVTGGVMTAGNIYQDLLDDGIDNDKALTAASIMLPVSTILQKVPLERIFSPTSAPSVRRAIARAGFTGLLEGTTEYTEEVLEGVIKSITKLGLTGEAAQEAGYNAIESLAVVIPSIIVGGGANIGNIRIEREKARNAQRNQEIIEALSTEIKDSKTLKRMPEKVQEYIRMVKEEAGGVVEDAYIPAELFQHAFQSEQDAISLAEKMGINEATYREAIATGADLKVPIESYLVNMAGTNEGVALQRDVRFSEDGFSANEADAYIKEYNTLINDTVAQISEEAQAAVASDTVSSDIHSSMVDSLRAVGYNKTVASANADMFIAMLRTLHSRYGEEMGLDLAMFADLIVPDIVKGVHHKPVKISVNEMHPSITAVIRKAGGINPESVTALGYNIKEFTQDFGFGLLRKGGIGLDELAETLTADSVISPAPSTTNTVEHLLSELRKNIHARRDFDPEAYTEAIAEEQAELYQSRNESSLNEYAKAIEAIFNNKPGENRILIGDTPDIYTEYGLKPLQLIMHRSKIKKIIEDHGITEEIFQQLPKSLVNPVAIFTSGSRKDDSIVVVTDMKDKNGDPVVASILYDVKEERHEVNIISSVYGKRNSKNVFDRWVKNGRLKYPENAKDKLAFRQWVRKGMKGKAPLYVPIEAPIASGSRSRGTPSPIGTPIVPGRGDAKDKSLTENNIPQNDNDVNKKDEELYQRQVDNLGFYSALESALDDIDFKTMPAKDLLNRIKKTPGIKQEEIEWIGLEDWLNGIDGRVAKEQVIDFVHRGGVKLTEVVHDNEPIYIGEDGEVATREQVVAHLENLKEQNIDMLLDDLGDVSAVDEDDPDTEWRYYFLGEEKTFATKEEADESQNADFEWVTEESHVIKADNDSFSLIYTPHGDAIASYTLSGGGEHGGVKYASYKTDGGENYSEYLLTIPIQEKTKWQYHGLDGITIYDTEEDALYAHNKDIKRLDYYIERSDDIKKLKLYNGEGLLRRDYNDIIGHFHPRIPTIDEAIKYLEGEREFLVSREKKYLRTETVSVGFYVSGHWDEKNVLVHARTQDFNTDSGKTLLIEEIQSDWHQEGRNKGYGDDGAVPNAPHKSTDAWAILAFKRMLRKAVDGEYDSIAWTIGKTQVERYTTATRATVDRIGWSKTDDGIEIAAIKNGNVNHKKNYTKDELAEVVGKSMAQQIISSPEQNGTLEGEDLTIGGEGMKGFYDNILPKAVQKYISKLDKSVKVGFTEINGEKAWNVEITPAIREEVLAGQTLFQRERPNDLYVVHNLSADNILHAEKMGGLPVPSIAVAKISAGGFENFGEISLIADKSLIDPEVNPAAKTYDSDIYSARYPTVNYALSRPETERKHDEFAEAEKAVGRPIDFNAVANEGVRALRDDRAVKYAYLEKNGLLPDDPTSNSEITEIIDERRQDFNDWVDETFKGVVSKEQIFTGYDREGDRRYLPHNLDNVIKIMKKEKKEGFGYGVGSVRSSVANKFNSVAEIQKNRNKIISDKDFEAVKKEIDDEFLELADKLRPFYKFDSSSFSYLSDVSEALQEYGAKGSRGISEYFTLDKEHLALVDSFMRKLANLPTTYFESKIQRAVNLSEFKYAVAPENTSAKIVSILEKHGLEVVKYKDGERTQAIEQLQDVLFQRPEQPKGAVSMFTVGGAKPLMKLFSGKDESTFIHETGHIYFQFLEQMAAQPEAPQGMRDDMEVVRKFVGNDGTALTREQHEKLSEALESYLIEGKSPSTGLTRIFQQFAGWLKALYDRVRRQKIKLSPEIRGLFDRMFATDLEIDEVKNFYGKQTDFTADLKDMDAEQAEDYRKKLERASVTERDKNIRRHAKAYKSAMARDINDSAEQAVSRQPIYRAIDAIINSGGVNGEDIEEAFGADTRKALSKKGLIAPEDAIPENTPLLAEIAIQQGYESDTALAIELLNAPTKKQAIADRIKELRAEAEETIATGLEEMELMAEANKGVAADPDYHSPERMAVIVAEQAIAAQRAQARERRAMNPRGIGEVELARKSMRERLRETKTAEAVQHYPFARAERKASDLAKKAIHKEDYAEAAKQKRRELLNHAGVLEAVAIRKSVDNMLSAVKKILRQKSVSKEAAMIIERVASRFGFVNPARGESLAETAARTATKNANAPALADWAKTAFDQGIPVALGELALSGEIRHWRDLTVSEMEQVAEDIRRIAHVDMVQRTALKNGRRIERKKLIDELNATAVKNQGNAKLKEIQSTMSKTGDNITELLVKAETLFRALDGETAGIWSMTFIDPLSKAASEEDIRRKKEGKRLYDIFAKHYGKMERDWRKPWQKKWQAKTFIKEIGESLAKEMMVAVALNVGNSDNINKLMEGRGWNPQQVEAILDKLDKRDWEFVQDVWDYVDSFREEWFAYGKKMTGVTPARVEPEPFTTKYGQKMKGGYYPLGWDSRLSNQDYKNELESLGLQPSGGTFHEIARVRQGSLTQRKKGSGGRAVNLSFNVLTQHVNEVVHAVTHGEVIANLSILLQDKKLGAVLKSTLGSQSPQQLKDWLLAVAKQGRKDLDWIERGVRFVRTKTTFLRLGFSLATGIKQFTGIFVTMSHGEIGTRQALRGFNLVFGTGGDYAELGKRISFIYDKSSFMRTRVSGFDRDIYDAASGLKAPSKLEQAGFMVIGYAQLSVDLPTWMAAYDLAIRKKGFDDDRAVAFADSIVRQTQGSGRTMDLSKVQRGSELHKLLTMFYSFHNTLANMTFTHWTDKNAPKLMAFIFWAMIVQPVMDALMSFDLPDDDEDESWLLWALGKMGGNAAGMIPFVRDIVSGVDYGYRGTPAETLPAQGVRLLQAGIKATETGEIEPVVKSAMRVFVPSQGIRMYNALVDVLNDDPDKALMMFLFGKDIDK